MLMIAPNGAKVQAADFAVERLKFVGFKPAAKPKAEKAEVEEKPKGRKKD